eukprot:GSChrysophyteH1.ASY1.ANO1.555.1 assembled CDS
MSVVSASAITNRYERKGELGQGTFGVVHDAVRRSDGLRVAIKRSKPMDSMKDSLHMVMEYCPFDLKDLVYDRKIFLSAAHIKSCMRMMLQGLEVCHSHFILHRDLKPANILLGADGRLKLADFGYARTYSSPREMTREVVTLAYRAPELLFESVFYGAGVDMWAVGCIFAEMMLRSPLFPGSSVIEQLAKIFNAIGTPTQANWPNCNMLPAFVEFEARGPLKLGDVFSTADESTLSLLTQLLALDPLKRITAADALKHPYFSEAPEATNPDMLPQPEKQ